MIDTCIGNDRKREFDVFCNLQNTFLEDLRTAGFPAEQVTDVLCTHLHFDHVGWNTRLVDGQWVPTFPGARYLFGRGEWQHWKHLRDTAVIIHMDHLVDSIDPVLAAGLEKFIDADFRLTDEVSLIATPGHTPGHVSVLIESRGERAVITGDIDAQPDPDRHPRHGGTLRHGQTAGGAHPLRFRAAFLRFRHPRHRLTLP